jgi:hypothetical protein
MWNLPAINQPFPAVDRNNTAQALKSAPTKWPQPVLPDCYMNTTEIFLIAMTIIFTVPYLIWRVGKTDYYAPLVVVQIITGILLGPGILGRAFPDYYSSFSIPPLSSR